jgi:metallo-beta-lactamase class B
MCTRCAFFGGLTALLTAPALAASRKGDPQALEIATPEMHRVSDTLWIGRLTPNVWIHTTTHVIDGAGYYPANGAIVIDGTESLLIDTGWNDADTTAILTEWQRRKNPPITKALVTHFHYDRLGGIPELTRRGIPAYGNPRTIGLAIDAGFKPPQPLHELEKHPRRLGNVEVFYPGAGHTRDNIVAWIPTDNVLFGGCLIKATTAPDLGNLADADVKAYPATIRTLMHKYSPTHTIPGHGTINGNSIAHTLKLTQRA